MDVVGNNTGADSPTGFMGNDESQVGYRGECLQRGSADRESKTDPVSKRWIRSVVKEIKNNIRKKEETKQGGTLCTWA